jgi:hypothetical protein
MNTLSLRDWQSAAASATIEAVELAPGAGFYLWVRFPDRDGIRLRNDRGEVRKFKTLDAVASLLRPMQRGFAVDLASA